MKKFLCVFLFFAFLQCASFASPVGFFKTKKIIKEYSKLIEKNPNNAELFYKRGKLYTAIGKDHDAIIDFQCAYSIKPDLSDAYLMSGLLYYFDNEYGWAFEEFNKMIENNPKVADGYYFRAMIYFYIHDDKNYEKDMKKYNELETRKSQGT